MGMKRGVLQTKSGGFTLIELLVVIAIIVTIDGFLSGGVRYARFLDQPTGARGTPLEFTAQFSCPSRTQFKMEPDVNNLGMVFSPSDQGGRLEFPVLKASSDVEYIEDNGGIDLKSFASASGSSPSAGHYHINAQINLDPSLLTSWCQASFVAPIDKKAIFQEVSPGTWQALRGSGAQLNFILTPQKIDGMELLTPEMLELLSHYRVDLSQVLPPFSASVLLSLSGVTVGNGGDQSPVPATGNEAASARGCGVSGYSPKNPMAEFICLLILFGATFALRIRRLSVRHHLKS